MRRATPFDESPTSWPMISSSIPLQGPYAPGGRGRRILSPERKKSSGDAPPAPVILAQSLPIYRLRQGNGAIDLAAGCLVLVDEERPCLGPRKRRCRRQTCRPRTDDDHVVFISEIRDPASLLTIPSVIGQAPV